MINICLIVLSVIALTVFIYFKVHESNRKVLIEKLQMSYDDIEMFFALNKIEMSNDNIEFLKGFKGIAVNPELLHVIVHTRMMIELKEKGKDLDLKESKYLDKIKSFGSEFESLANEFSRLSFLIMRNSLKTPATFIFMTRLLVSLALAYGFLAVEKLTSIYKEATSTQLPVSIHIPNQTINSNNSLLNPFFGTRISI